MNDHLVTSSVGLQLIASFEGTPRLKARLCEGGRYELSYGCTTWPDGRPVEFGETCDVDQALKLFAFHIHRFEAVVKKHVTVPLTQLQFDALVALVYNIGEANFVASTVLRMTNSRRFEDAAAAFSMFVYATKTAAQRTTEPESWFQDPDGNPCSYMRALRGLLRRHLAEGLVYLGYQWEKACEDGAIWLRAEMEYQPAHKRNKDRVTSCTTFNDVLAVAMQLPKLSEPLPPAEPVVDVPFDLDAWEAKVEAQTSGVPYDGAAFVEAAKEPPKLEPASTVTQSTPDVVLGPSVTPAPAPRPLPPAQPGPKPPVSPPPLEYRVPKGAPMPTPPPPAKKLEATRRFWGAFLFYGGKLFMVLGVSTLPGKFAVAFGETWGAVVKDPQLFGMAIDALTFSTGFFADHAGAWIRKWGERKAKGPIVSGSEAPRVTGGA